MTEELDTGQPVDVDENSWFDSWLETGTVAQRSVEIYGRPDLFAQFEDLERKLAIAKEVEKAGEKTVGDTGVDTIIEQLESLYAKWQASKTTWFIRALTSAEIEEIREDCHFPEEPDKDATEDQVNAYRKANNKADTDANQRMVSRALVKVENPDGKVVKEAISPAEVAAMRSKLGDNQVLRLVAAAMVAMTQEVSIPVPLSRKNSKSDRNS